MGLGRRATDAAAVETLKSIRQIAVSLAKGLPMEALAVAGNCLTLLEGRTPLNEQQREAVKQFLQTLSFNRVPLGPSEAAVLIQRAENLVKTSAGQKEESARANEAVAADERVGVGDDTPEFRSVLGAVRTYEERLEMMVADRSFAKMPRDKARAFLQAVQDALQATRRRYANARIEDAAQRVIQKARDIYSSL